MQDEAPGLVFWHPKGWAIWQEIEQYMRAVYRNNGYQEVRCPQILDKTLWEKSGHWEHYKDNMFTTSSENRDYAVKPMNCPGHVQVFNSDLRIANCHCAMVSSVPAIATSQPGPCMA